MQGLVLVENKQGKVVLLTSRVSSDSPLAPGSDITYANDLVIAKDGTIYFTDSTTIHTRKHPEGYWDTFNSYVLAMLQVSWPYKRFSSIR